MTTASIGLFDLVEAAVDLSDEPQSGKVAEPPTDVFLSHIQFFGEVGWGTSSLLELVEYLQLGVGEVGFVDVRPVHCQRVQRVHCLHFLFETLRQRGYEQQDTKDTLREVRTKPMERIHNDMAVEQTTEIVGDVKIERCGSSVRLRQTDGSGNEVFVDFDDMADVTAVMREVARDA